jgi:RNA polymerase sigma factor (sigma-70 family)
MMGLCVRYTKDEEDAKLVLNSGFLKVFKHIHQFDPAKAGIYTWMRTIIINVCLDHIKSKQRTIAANELHEAETVHIEPEVNTRLKTEEILQLIRNLPPVMQAVFNLSIMEGYSHKEIAILLQISEGTSKWHLSEARKKLKLQLQNRIYSE